MKKLILFSVLFLFGMISVQAQKMTFASGTDTVVDADIHYYPITQYFTRPGYIAIQMYVDHLTGSSDSTQITFQGSADYTNWNTLGTVQAAGSYTLYTAAAPTTLHAVTWTTVDGAFLWTPTALMTWPYIRAKVQHYATGTVSVTTGVLWFYPLYK